MTGTDWIAVGTLLLGLYQLNAQPILTFLSNFPAGLATGLVVALITLIGKYLLEYRVQSRRLSLDERLQGSEDERATWRLQAEARQEVYAVVGRTQASFVRAAMELHDRLSNFLSQADHTRPWLIPGSSLEKDEYYLREFMRRLFNFYAMGHIAQDAINSLPVELVRVRDDLQRLYTFVNLVNSLITYTWLFKGVDKYEDRSENLHLFAGNLSRLTETGVNIWKKSDETIPRDSFNELYNAGNEPLMTLRDLVVATYAEDNEVGHPNRRAAFVIARFAVLRAVVGAYLSLDHAWALALPEDEPISAELDRDLDYAGSLVPGQPDLPQLVRRNLGELMHRFRCEWLPVNERPSPSKAAPK